MLSGTGSLEPAGGDFRCNLGGRLRHTPDKLWHDAVHEAGHAVIARILGVTSAYANLSSNCDEVSAADFILDAMQAFEWNQVHAERHAADGAFWRRKIIARIAGAEAEREIIGVCLGDDEHHRLSCELELGHAHVQSERTVRMHSLARQLVKRHRAAILSFAEQLVAAADLDELLTR
jgi:hypothetical protein